MALQKLVIPAKAWPRAGGGGNPVKIKTQTRYTQVCMIFVVTRARYTGHKISLEILRLFEKLLLIRKYNLSAGVAQLARAQPCQG